MLCFSNLDFICKVEMIKLHPQAAFCSWMAWLREIVSGMLVLILCATLHLNCSLIPVLYNLS